MFVLATTRSVLLKNEPDVVLLFWCMTACLLCAELPHRGSGILQNRARTKQIRSAVDPWKLKQTRVKSMSPTAMVELWRSWAGPDTYLVESRHARQSNKERTGCCHHTVYVLWERRLNNSKTDWTVKSGSDVQIWNMILFIVCLAPEMFSETSFPFYLTYLIIHILIQVFFSLLKKRSLSGLGAADEFVECNSILVTVVCGCRSKSTPK